MGYRYEDIVCPKGRSGKIKVPEYAGVLSTYKSKIICESDYGPSSDQFTCYHLQYDRCTDGCFYVIIKDLDTTVLTVADWNRLLDPFGRL